MKSIFYDVEHIMIQLIHFFFLKEKLLIKCLIV